jgi:hypothetical protein
MPKIVICRIGMKLAGQKKIRPAATAARGLANPSELWLLTGEEQRGHFKVEETDLYRQAHQYIALMTDGEIGRFGLQGDIIHMKTLR